MNLKYILFCLTVVSVNLFAQEQKAAIDKSGVSGRDFDIKLDGDDFDVCFVDSRFLYAEQGEAGREALKEKLVNKTFSSYEDLETFIDQTLYDMGSKYSGRDVVECLMNPELLRVTRADQARKREDFERIHPTGYIGFKEAIRELH
jgi:hypothetical protein